jgi:hypothetical protein
MYTQEYEFTAVHEAGHAVCIAQFSPANTAVTSLAIPLLYLNFRDLLEKKTKHPILINIIRLISCFGILALTFLYIAFPRDAQRAVSKQAMK